MIINNVENLTNDFICKDSLGLITKEIGSMAGSKKLYVNIDSVPPNAFSTKYHSHSQQEEFFLVLEGFGTLVLNNISHAVKKGDFISKLPGQNIAHTFYNSSDNILVILDVGTVEKEDTCYYPEEGVYLHKSNGLSTVFKKQQIIENWSSDPN